MILKIGTRGSRLALIQSAWVRERIEEAHPGIRVEVIKIKTTGDKILDSPLSKIGGKGLFVKEIEDALLRGEIDLAVHSMKDVPAELPEALMLCAFPEREDPRDALISRHDLTLAALPKGAVVGTSSLRRAAQIRHVRPDVKTLPLRGNVETRIRKMEKGEVDAVVLARAGLKRLGLLAQISETLLPEQVIPAVGQGALGLEVRREDHATRRLLGFLNHPSTEVAVRAERSFLKRLEGGCQVPLAAFADLKDGKVRMSGMVAELDGSRVIREQADGTQDQPEALGIALAERLLEAGAGDILARIYGTS
jgi:hydroxymethylbilane synthase